jgi:hypothetical protein
MTAERKKKTIEELKKKLPDALSKLAGKSISAVEFGKLTIAEVPSVLLLLELKVEHDAFSKLAKPGLVKNIMEVAFLFFPSICEKSASGFNPPSSSCPPPLRWLLLKIGPPPDRVSKRPVARIRRAREGDASTITEYEDDGAMVSRNQDDQVMNIFLKDYGWNQVWKCGVCDDFGGQKGSCEHCGVLRPAGVIASCEE